MPCSVISYTHSDHRGTLLTGIVHSFAWGNRGREASVRDIPEKMPSHPEVPLPWSPPRLLPVSRGTGCLWHCFCTPSAPQELSPS